MREFCVYAHFKGSTQKDMFYIGKGQAKRVLCEDSRNPHWKNVVNKHGFNVLALHDNLTEEEAFDLEVRFIALYRAMGHKLVNMTDGGEGVSGLKMPPRSAKHKKLLGAVNVGKKRRLGHKNSEEHNRKIAAALVGNTNGVGHVVSEKTRQKMSQTQKGISVPSRSRPKTAEEKEYLRHCFKGRVSPMKGRTHSPETKAKMREARLRNPTLKHIRTT
jgi:hypothetical protein